VPVILLAASSSSTSAFDQPGTLGFLVVFGMAIILFFVFRSMSRHLRKVNEAARAEEAAAARAQAEATVTDAPSGGNGVSSAG
jgi:Na+-transporting methylmalonyl-CoA/oxaloacetate decarboxylase gamma subunit